MTDADSPALTVSDAVLARVAAHAAAGVPGVVRLQPYVVQAARSAVSDAARRATARLTGASDGPGDGASGDQGADPDAVQVERDNGVVTVTVRVVVSTDPPVRESVRDAAERVRDQLREIVGVEAAVVISVLDVDF